MAWVVFEGLIRPHYLHVYGLEGSSRHASAHRFDSTTNQRSPCHTYSLRYVNENDV